MRKQLFSFLSRLVKGGAMVKKSPRWAPAGVTILLLLLVTAPRSVQGPNPERHDHHPGPERPGP